MFYFSDQNENSKAKLIFKAIFDNLQKNNLKNDLATQSWYFFTI